MFEFCRRGFLITSPTKTRHNAGLATLWYLLLTKKEGLEWDCPLPTKEHGHYCLHYYQMGFQCPSTTETQSSSSCNSITLSPNLLLQTQKEICSASGGRMRHIAASDAHPAATTPPPPPPSHNQDNLGLMELCLRFSVIPLTVASLCVVVQDRQVSYKYGKMVYSDFSGFKYLISVDAISAFYTIIAIFFSVFKPHKFSEWFFYISDQAIAYLMITSVSSVVEILYLAYKGDRDVTWSEACTSYGMFCRRATVSVLLHFVALMCFVALALISAFRTFSKFDPPPPPASCKEVEMEQT